MAAIGNATALAALDAVVIDTETTGLDPAKAWIVEIGAVRIAGGRLAGDVGAHPLAHPAQSGRADPRGGQRKFTASTMRRSRRRRGSAAAVRTFPPRSARTVLIGHSLGFDLAVLKREFARAGVAWQPPRTLDTRLLAEVAAPELAGYSLDSLSAWLGVAMGARHSALGRRRNHGARVPRALPKLREAGIRTLAEAERACRGMTATLEGQHRAGWAEPVQAPDAARRGRAHRQLSVSAPRGRRDERAGSFHCAGCAACRRTGAHDARARVVAVRASRRLRPPGRGRMRPASSPSAMCCARSPMAARRRLTQPGRRCREPPARAPSRPTRSVYLAIARMNRRGVRHLGVTDAAGFVIGARVGTRSAAAARRGRDCARRRDRGGGRCARAGARLAHMLPRSRRRCSRTAYPAARSRR